MLCWRSPLTSELSAGRISPCLLFSSKCQSPGKPVVSKASEAFTADKACQLLWFMLEVSVTRKKI